MRSKLSVLITTFAIMVLALAAVSRQAQADSLLKEYANGSDATPPQLEASAQGYYLGQSFSLPLTNPIQVDNLGTWDDSGGTATATSKPFLPTWLVDQVTGTSQSVVTYGKASSDDTLSFHFAAHNPAASPWVFGGDPTNAVESEDGRLSFQLSAPLLPLGSHLGALTLDPLSDFTDPALESAAGEVTIIPADGPATVVGVPASGSPVEVPLANGDSVFMQMWYKLDVPYGKAVDTNYTYSVDIDPSTVPEPGTIVLLAAVGMVLIVGWPLRTRLVKAKG